MNKEIWKLPKRCTEIGGEALIEGIMMRSKEGIATAIRKESGEITIDTKKYIALTKRNKLAAIPIIRGEVVFIETRVIVIKALMDSADAIEMDEEKTKFELFLEKIFGDKLMDVVLYFSVIIALAFSIGLFILLPNQVIDFIKFDKQTPMGSFIANLLEGVLRIVIFFGYIILVSKMKDIKRVFEYHGAEHKTLYCIENEEELTVENAKKHTRFHPRCGTAFMFIVMIISILIFSFTGWHNRIINTLIRLALIPFIAGISYEVFKITAKRNGLISRIIRMPGLFLQRFTTQEPDDGQLEIAIAALKAVLDIDNRKENEEEAV